MFEPNAENDCIINEESDSDSNFEEDDDELTRIIPPEGNSKWIIYLSLIDTVFSGRY